VERGAALTDLIVPLTLEQEWFFARRIADGGRWMPITRTLDIDGPLDISHFLMAFRAVIRRHQGMRTTIGISEAGEPHQVIHSPSEDIPLTCQWVACRSRQQFEAYASSAARADVMSRWNPVRDPLYRMRLLRRSEDEHILLAAFDHLAFDDRSAELFFHYLWAAYRDEEGVAAISGEPDVGSDLADTVRAERDRYAIRAAGINADYWARSYAQAPATWTLNQRGTHQAKSGWKCDVATLDLDVDATARVRAAVAKAGTTTLVACVAVFAWTVFNLTVQDRVAIYMPLDNRGSADRGIIGNFACVRPVIVDRTDGPPTAYLEQVAGKIFRALAYRHMDWASENRCELAQLASAPTSSAYRGLSVNYLRADGVETTGALTARLRVRRTGYAPRLVFRTSPSLTLLVRDWPGALQLTFVYTTELFTPERAQSALSSYAVQVMALGSSANGTTPRSSQHHANLP
jgi:hypothetical protein